MAGNDAQLLREECRALPPRHRDSNIELFRILSMILIIAHHYVVNSGLTDAAGTIYSDPMSWRSIFLLIFGGWGKIGINCFVLITGYFMCKSKITSAKFFKLLFEIMFYRIVIASIFWITGYEAFSFKALIKTLIPVSGLGTGFSSAFLLFYLAIPFVTVLVRNLNEKQHIKLLLLSGFIYVVLGTVPFFSVTMNYLSWFIVLFFFASYISLYPKRVFENAKVWGLLSLLFLVLCVASVVVCTWLGMKLDKKLTYYFVADSNKILALFSGVSFFLFFKNLKIKYSRFINTVAASTFGVLLIHASSDTMRRWLWKDTLNNVGWYDSSLMPLHAVGSVLGIFVICVCVDRLRILLIEKPLFKVFEKFLKKAGVKYLKIEDKFINRIGQK